MVCEMGLDMFLEKYDKAAWKFKDLYIPIVEQENPELYKRLKPLIVNGEYGESLSIEVAYWRKANAIHRWFVENVQDGLDDCGTYEVTKEQLQELLNICISVRDGSEMEKGWIENGATFKNGMWCPVMQEGEYISNPNIAESLLPTQRGFFFGGTEYDEWYMHHINDTIEMLVKILDETDFDKEIIAYTSSW